MLTATLVSTLNPPLSRKRKAEDDEPYEVRILDSPALHTHSQPTHQRPLHKRSRTEPLGRPLSLPRLLETLDAESLRSTLHNLCTQHPSIAHEVEAIAPRPSVVSALSVLKSYEDRLQASFPFGGDHTSDYAYNRVRQPLLQLLDALTDYVPHFLPPNEPQPSQSLTFLDGATEIIHRLPNWHSFQNNLHKQEAFEEVCRAWIVAIQEAGKRAGGMQLKYEGWEQRLNKHNATSGGRLQEAMEELERAIGWIGSEQSQQALRSDDLSAIRQELLSGSYGSGVPLRVGPW